ncbi:unnamed protein product [Jaminaea pallidilutea]
MPVGHPFLECSPLASAFYRRREVYSLAWGHSDLADFLLAAAPNGGLLALTRDPRRLVALGKASILKPKILVYTAAGQLVDTIPWDPSNRIVGFGFTESEQLVVVLDEGLVRVYTLMAPCPSPPSTAAATQSSNNSSSNNDSNRRNGKANATDSRPNPATTNCYFRQYSLGQEATETGIVEARVWSGGLVALTGGGRFVDFRFPASGGSDEEEDSDLFEDYRQPPVPELLPHFVNASSSSAVALNAGPSIPGAWTLIPPTVSSSGLLEVLLSPPPPVPAPTPSSRGGGASGAQTSSSSPSPPAYDAGTVLSLDSVSGCSDMRLSRGPFSSISASPNGKLLALLLTKEKLLWVVSSDFQRSLSEFDVTDCEAYHAAEERRRAGHHHGHGHGAGVDESLGGLASTGIREIQWCGNNTVALAFEREVVMVGPFGDSLRYEYPSSIHLVPETDGVRTIGAERHEFIQKVADSTAAVFRPGSSEPAALLLDASDSYNKRSAKADEALRAISSNLVEAVDGCIDAASHEWEVLWQRRLLKAAALGKSFLDGGSYDSTGFVELSRTLRVLNNVRDYEVGVPISYEQLNETGAMSLIARLTGRNHHLLALRIAEHLNLRPDSILKHWARAKIARSRSTGVTPNGEGGGTHDEDEILCSQIVRKFESQEGGGGDGRLIGAVSYASIASSAFAAGKSRLATKLLDHEPRAVDQVPLLLKMGEDRRALDKSVESGDTDLVYHVLLRLKSQLSRGDFFRIVQSACATAGTADGSAGSVPVYRHLAARLLEAYARESDQELLKDLFFTDDRRVDAALLALESVSRLPPLPDNAAPRLDALSSRLGRLKEAQKLFSEDRERNLESKLVEDSIKLSSFQSALEREDGGRSQWLEMSLNDTLRQLLIRGWSKKAEKFKSDFKVSDRRYGMVRVDAAIKTRDWQALWVMCGGNTPTSKRNQSSSVAGGVGFEPVIAKLLAAGHRNEALKYVERVVLVGDKADKARFSSLLNRLPPAVASPLQAKADEVTK